MSREKQSPIVRIIRELDAGDVEEALSDRLSEVVEALEEHGGKGQLKLTLMMERNEFGRIEVRPKIEAKKPGRSLLGNQYVIKPGGQLDLFDAPVDPDKAKPSGVTIN